MYIFLYSVFHIGIIILAILFQVSFIQPLEIIFYNLNLVYVIISLLLFYDRIYLFLVWLIIGGFLLDSLSSFPFGFFLGVFLVSVSLLYILLMKFLTNRSIYALVLYEVIALLIFNSVLFMSALGAEFLFSVSLGLSWGKYFMILYSQLFLVVIATIVIFMLIQYIGKPIKKFLF